MTGARVDGSWSTPGSWTHDRQGRNRVYTADHSRLPLRNEWLAWFEKDPLA